LNNAYRHTKKLGIPIVFCILGPLWVVEFFPQCVPPLPQNLAVIGQDWRKVGYLPMYEFSRWNSQLEIRNEYPSGNSLPFDPDQYPPKPKKKAKPDKSKSTKLRYSKGFDDAYRWYRGSSERED
jgi:hypothetical protein